MAYVAGDFWRCCERCGFDYRASNTAKEWTGLTVCTGCFDPRHPQDFVRGQRDNQTVPDPRPEPPDSFIGPLTTTTTAVAAAGGSTITVESSARFITNDRIGVMLSDGDAFRAIVQSAPTATSIALTTVLPGGVSIGAAVINYSAVSQPNVG